ncbi:hypothetical protein DPMN_049125 [Dreissena polymorpha]|uniref:Uncharacterized protein n=1 Tax=Dreissena polymorpha TaxID=45954 RepID=A0A9D4DEM9_DREPO|nr:hypothetical protein DPMN_042046 [Dreissena polymorpha]KAH3742383.1 hypothetical protein DPMN_049125 [Dreissena polymorpha]
MNKIEDEIHVLVHCPLARNRFNGNGYRQDFLEHWNYDAGVVNKLLREFASKVPWVRVIEHPEFHTMFGANVYLLSRDGLHLTIDVQPSRTYTYNTDIRIWTPALQ